MSEEQIVGLTLLLEKPAEPLIVPKYQKVDGDYIVLEMPESYYNKKYRNHASEIRQKFDVKKSKNIQVNNLTIPSKLISEIAEIDTAFSIFIPKHMDYAVALINMFKEAKNVEDLLSLAAYCRERVNHVMFNYALSVAVLHREDTKDIPLPNFMSSFPGKFVEATVFSDIRQTANLMASDNREAIVIRRNFTATNREPEQAVAYFREDVGINLHHWHWHLVYPTRGGPEVVGKDRRGELFYYMHEQVLARYNTERLCNNLGLVVSLRNLREPIPEGYFPKLTQINANRAWPPRFRNTTLRNIDRPGDRVDLSMERLDTWFANIRRAIRERRVTDASGRVIQLNEVSGIDILGNLIEATELSVNRGLYGNYHNMGHVLISFCHDPDERYLEGFSIMGDVATAMRDPIFYRWHGTINDLFVEHKLSLEPYGEAELDYIDLTVTDVKVQVPGRVVNEINTYWQQSDIDLSSGLDFVPKGPLPIRITHLQHGEFTYTISVLNHKDENIKGTMRIFMAPKFDQNNRPLLFNAQRQLMIEMDKFVVELNPGTNNIQRKSIDSSVTIEYTRTFGNVNRSAMSRDEVRRNNFCNCGWPDHMLVPRGTAAGYKMDLFVMVSDYNIDRIDQNPSDVCPGADSYCGVFNSKYPDSRSMGYPFDRAARENVLLEKTLFANMKVVEVTIRHENRTDMKSSPMPEEDPTVVPSTF